MNIDPVAQELSSLRNQVQVLQEILSKYKKGIDVIKENILTENTSDETLPGLDSISTDSTRTFVDESVRKMPMLNVR